MANVVPGGEPDSDAPAEGSADAPARRLTWRRISDLVSLAASRPTLVAFLGASLFVGFLEAGVILVVVAVAASLARGSDVVSVSPGPIDVSLSVGEGLGVGAVLLVALLLCAGTSARLSARMAQRLLHGLRNRLFTGLVSASWGQQSRVVDAQFQELVSVHTWRIANTGVVLATFTTSVLAFTALVAAIFVVNPLTAVTLLAAGLLLAVAFRPLMRSVRHRSRRTLAAHHRYVRAFADVFSVLPEIRIFRAATTAIQHVNEHSEAAAREYRRLVFRSRLIPVFYLGSIVGMLLGGLAVAATVGTLDLALVGALVLFLLRGLRYSQQAQQSWQTAVEQVPYLDDVQDALDQLGTNAHVFGSRRLDHAHELQLRDVGYRYPTGEVGVEGVTLTIHHGEIVGLVGPSGAGKSTIAQILLGLRRPTSGQYLVDGIPAQEYEESSWFARLAYVSQEPMLVEGTIEDNVRFFRTELSAGDVAEALDRAAMRIDLDEWHAGSGRQVGSRGRELSGGQRQRIAIARALAGHPDVLVMDEPTSALDAESERLVRSTLDRLRGEVTVILVAHRESTLDVCDRVVNVDRGNVWERPAFEATDA